MRITLLTLLVTVAMVSAIPADFSIPPGTDPINKKSCEVSIFAFAEPLAC